MDETKKTEVIINLGADRTDGILQRDVMQQLLKLLPASDCPAEKDSSDTWPRTSRTPVSLQIDPQLLVCQQCGVHFCPDELAATLDLWRVTANTMAALRGRGGIR